MKVIESTKNSINAALESRSILEPKCNKINVADFFNNIINDNYYELIKNNIILEKNIEFTGNILIDEEWLQSIMNNIIMNSIKAYSKIRLSDRICSLLVAKNSSNEISILWEDMAGGMDDYLVTRMNDVTKSFVISGKTGLNIIKNYVHKMGGTILCEKTRGNPEGTKLTLTFGIMEDKKDV